MGTINALRGLRKVLCLRETLCATAFFLCCTLISGEVIAADSVMRTDRGITIGRDAETGDRIMQTSPPRAPQTTDQQEVIIVSPEVYPGGQNGGHYRPGQDGGNRPGHVNRPDRDRPDGKPGHGGKPGGDAGKPGSGKPGKPGVDSGKPGGGSGKPGIGTSRPDGKPGGNKPGADRPGGSHMTRPGTGQGGPGHGPLPSGSGRPHGGGRPGIR